MTRNRILALALAALTTASAAAFAESFGDRARVVSVRPVLERIPVSVEPLAVRSLGDTWVAAIDDATVVDGSAHADGYTRVL